MKCNFVPLILIIVIIVAVVENSRVARRSPHSNDHEICPGTERFNDCTVDAILHHDVGGRGMHYCFCPSIIVPGTKAYRRAAGGRRQAQAAGSGQAGASLGPGQRRASQCGTDTGKSNPRFRKADQALARSATSCQYLRETSPSHTRPAGNSPKEGQKLKLQNTSTPSS